MPFNLLLESGRPVTVRDEGIPITSNVASLDFVGTNVTGTAIGDNVTEDLTGAGNVNGPATSTDNAIVRFNGTTGNVIQNSSYHTITDTGDTIMKTVPNSYDGFQFRDASDIFMAHIDTRGVADLVSGGSKYYFTGVAGGGGGPGLVGSNTAHTGIQGSAVLGSGTQTNQLTGISGGFVSRGACIANAASHRAGRFQAFWQSSGALTSALYGFENGVYVGSSSQPTGLVSQVAGTISQIGFLAGSQAAAITTAFGFQITQPVNTDATHTIGTVYGYNIQDQKRPGVTNAYALNIQDQSSGGYAIQTGNGKHRIGGGVTFKRTATAIDYLTTINDHTVAVTNTAAPRTVTLSTASLGEGTATAAFILTVKDESGGAAANNITIATEGAELIDGAATAVINANYGVVRVYSNGTNWFTI